MDSDRIQCNHSLLWEPKHTINRIHRSQRLNLVVRNDRLFKAGIKGSYHAMMDNTVLREILVVKKRGCLCTTHCFKYEYIHVSRLNSAQSWQLAQWVSEQPVVSIHVSAHCFPHTQDYLQPQTLKTMLGKTVCGTSVQQVLNFKELWALT
jgi:hypothetical protein